MENQNQPYDNMDDDVTAVIVNPDVMYQQELAQIDRQIATAKAFPRNLTRCIDNAIAVVTMDEETAATCTYALPRGGKVLSGPSVHLAKVLAQCWKNMRIEARIVAIDEKQITSHAVAFDLENNLAIKMEVKRSIMTKNGRMNDDMITVTGNAANSIALRNAVLSVIPRAVVDKVYKAAKQKITGNVSDKNALIKLRTDIFAKFKDDYLVTEREVLDSIGKASLANITQDDLVTLIGFGTSIADGSFTVETVFKSKSRSSAAPDPEKDEIQQKKQDAKLKELTDLLPLVVDKLTNKERTDIGNVIKDKDFKSYDKIIKKLTLKQSPQ